MSQPDINHPNKVLRYFSVIRPQLWQAKDFEKVAFLLHYLSANGTPSWNDVTDALAELVPDQREFWLRVQATWNWQFWECLAHSFEEDMTDDEALVIGAAIGVKNAKS